MEQRIDAALVSQGLARSRGQARDLVEAGFVSVNGKTMTKVSQKISADQTLIVAQNDWHHLVSRGGAKLLDLVNQLPWLADVIRGASVADLGACTGGFTQVLLEYGAKHVAAVDVGHDQLHTDLAADERVSNLEGLHVRDLTTERLGGHCDVIVGDLSFISLTQVVPVVKACIIPEGTVALLVKPQFEVGKKKLGSSGVVSDPKLWVSSIMAVLGEVGTEWQLQAIVPCQVAGPSGNREFFCVWRATEQGAQPAYELEADVVAAVETMKVRVFNV